MKLKGINPFEQHVDKAVLGLSGVAFLGVLAVQFLTQPNAVKVGSATLAPEDAFQPAEEAAKQLDAQMKSESPPLPEVPAQNDYAKVMADRLAAGIAPRPTIKPLGTSIAFAAGAATQAVPTDLVLGELALPSPLEVVAATHRAAIDPIDKVGVPGLAALLPPAQPYDKATVSVQGKFDGTALKRLFETDPDGEGPQSALPLGWWRDGVEVIAVEVERERLQSDGTWGEATVLPPVPGRVNLLPTWAQVKTADQATQGVITARTESNRVLRPTFYRIIAGPKWIEPATAVAMVGKGSDQTQIDKWKADLKKLDEEIPALKQQVDAMPKDERPATRPPNEGAPAAAGGGGGGRRGGAPGGGGQGGRAAPPPKGSDANKPKPRWALEEQLRGKQGRRKILVARLKAAGVDVEAAPQPGAAEPAALVEAPLLDNANVKFWAHDLTVQPGATYRYRTRMVLNNPVFGRALFLKDDQKAMAEQALARGAWSDWSDEVAVDPDQAFFVTSATPQGDASVGQGVAKATAEVFKFYYGAYRRAAVGLEPGDMIALDMKLPAGLLIYDESKLPAARPEEAPGVPSDPRGLPGNAGGGRRMGGQMGGPGGPGVPPPPEPPPGAIAGLPPGDGKPGPEKMSYSSDLVLLGVAPGVAAETGGTEAMFRKADGMVIARLPEAERTSAAYKRFDASARAAEETTKAKTEQKAPTVPSDPRDPRAGR